MVKGIKNEKEKNELKTVKEELDKKKDLSAIGGIEYISEVIDSVATAANLDYYIKIVKDKALIRNLIDTATNKRIPTRFYTWSVFFMLSFNFLSKDIFYGLFKVEMVVEMVRFIASIDLVERAPYIE